MVLLSRFIFAGTFCFCFPKGVKMSNTPGLSSSSSSLSTSSSEQLAPLSLVRLTSSASSTDSTTSRKRKRSSSNWLDSFSEFIGDTGHLTEESRPLPIVPPQEGDNETDEPNPTPASESGSEHQTEGEPSNLRPAGGVPIEGEEEDIEENFDPKEGYGEADTAAVTQQEGRKQMSLYCFTSHTGAPVINAKSMNGHPIIFCCYQKEQGSETQKEHWQGFIAVKKGMRYGELQDLIQQKAHFFYCRGTPLQNLLYCTKRETRLEEPKYFGNFQQVLDGKTKKKQINMSTYAAMLIRQGLSDFELAALLPSFCLQNRKKMAEYRDACTGDQCRRRAVYVEVWHGQPGTGKTSQVFARWNDDDVYIKTTSDKNAAPWWDGYTGQPVVVFDEFTGANISATTMNDICGGAKMRVMVKGGSTPAKWTHVVIISNYPPAKWWTPEVFSSPIPDGVRQAFMDRISTTKDGKKAIVCFNGPSLRSANVAEPFKHTRKSVDKLNEDGTIRRDFLDQSGELSFTHLHTNSSTTHQRYTDEAGTMLT